MPKPQSTPTYAELLERLEELAEAHVVSEDARAELRSAHRDFERHLMRILGYDHGGDPPVVSDVRRTWCALQECLERIHTHPTKAKDA